MKPEEFVDEMFSKDELLEWQRKFLIEFLKLPKSERNRIVSPRRGDGWSQTRTLLSLCNLMNEEKFVKVTEHYGYYHRQLDGYDCKHYDIYRIFGCHSER